MRLRLRNTLARHRRLTATYYAEWVLGSLREEQRPYIASEFDRGERLPPRDVQTGMPSSANASRSSPPKASVHGFTADRTEFLGRRGDYARPEALERWGLSGRVDLGADPCAALQVHLDLAPGEEMETHFVLGQASSRAEALQLVARFRDAAVVEAAWSGLHAFWDEVLGSVRVKTPEPAMDLMLNRWLLYQTLSSRVFGRTASTSRAARSDIATSSRTFSRCSTRPPSDRARPHPGSSRAPVRGGGRAALVASAFGPRVSGRAARTTWHGSPSSPPSTSPPRATTSNLSTSPCRSFTGEPLQPDEHDRYAQFEASPLSAPLFEHCSERIERAATEGAPRPAL